MQARTEFEALFMVRERIRQAERNAASRLGTERPVTATSSLRRQVEAVVAAIGRGLATTPPQASDAL